MREGKREGEVTEGRREKRTHKKRPRQERVGLDNNIIGSSRSFLALLCQRTCISPHNTEGGLRETCSWYPAITRLFLGAGDSVLSGAGWAISGAQTVVGPEPS